MRRFGRYGNRSTEPLRVAAGFFAVASLHEALDTNQSLEYGFSVYEEAYIVGMFLTNRGNLDAQDSNVVINIGLGKCEGEDSILLEERHLRIETMFSGVVVTDLAARSSVVCFFH